MIQVPVGDVFAVIDDSDFSLVSQYSWHKGDNKRGHVYPLTSINGKTERMHRVILGLRVGDGRIVDHANGDGLDNRRANLRICTRKQNVVNSKRGNNESGYKGVFRSRGKWIARIGGDNGIYLGIFNNKELAAIVYDLESIKRYGEFARTNLDHSDPILQFEIKTLVKYGVIQRSK